MLEIPVLTIRLQLVVITLLQVFIHKCNAQFYYVTFCVFCENYLENVGELQENFLWLKYLKSIYQEYNFLSNANYH